MKKNILIGLGIVALAMGFGAGIIGFETVEPTEASAGDTAKGDYDIFLDATGVDGYGASVIPNCHNWGSSETSWPGTAMTRINGSLFGVKLKNPSNNKCIFNIDGDSHKGPELTVEKGKTYFWKDGNWRDQVDAYLDSSDQSASTSSFRVFVHNSDVTSTWGSGSETMIRVTGSPNYSYYDGAVYKLTWFQNTGNGASSNWYGYADIPTNAEKFQIVRTNANCPRCIWNWGPSITVTEGIAHGARIYKMKDKGSSYSDWNNRFDELSSTTNDAHVGPDMMNNILKAYTTCDMSVLNGVGAYTDLNNNFFKDATSDAKNQTVTTLGTGAVSAKASVHIAAMLARQGGIPKAQIVNSGLSTNNSALIIGGLAFVGLAAAGTMIFAAKKRKDI